MKKQDDCMEGSSSGRVWERRDETYGVRTRIGNETMARRDRFRVGNEEMRQWQEGIEVGTGTGMKKQDDSKERLRSG